MHADQDAARLRAAAVGGRRLPVGTRLRPARLDDQPRGDRLPRRLRPRRAAWRAPASRSSAAPLGSPARAGSRSRRRRRRPRSLETRNVVIAAGSTPFIPPIEGLADVGLLDEQRRVVGPRAAVVARRAGRRAGRRRAGPGLRAVRRQGHAGRGLAPAGPRAPEDRRDRLRPARTGGHRHPPRRPRREGRTAAARAGSSSSTTAPRSRAPSCWCRVGRRAADLRAMGAEEAGGRLTDRGTADHDERLSIGDGLFVAGDAAGGLQFTHVADYEGRIAAAAAFGDDVARRPHLGPEDHVHRTGDRRRRLDRRGGAAARASTRSR